MDGLPPTFGRLGFRTLTECVADLGQFDELASSRLNKRNPPGLSLRGEPADRNAKEPSGPLK
ncbi:MAG: hypothetical protein AAF663_00425 [Planctomycetota bacterium]